MPCGSWKKNLGPRNNLETAERTSSSPGVLSGAADGLSTGETERHETGKGVTAHQHIGAKTVAEHGCRHGQHEDEGTEGKEEGGFHGREGLALPFAKRVPGVF